MRFSRSTLRIIEEPLRSRPLTSTDSPRQPACRLGVLAFGDSITNGGGDLQWGVALQSCPVGGPWAGACFHQLRARRSVRGDVIERQLPSFAAGNATPDARFDLGCLYIGVNDVRTLDWDAGRFEADFRTALRALMARCDRVLTLTVPLDLGRPRAGAKVQQLDAVVERVAEELDVLLVDLRDFRARNHVMPDHVHPTAFGQIAIAERALDVLARRGLPTRVRPGMLISYQITRWRRLRSDSTYLYRHAKVSARAVALTLAASRWPR